MSYATPDGIVEASRGVSASLKAWAEKVPGAYEILYESDNGYWLYLGRGWTQNGTDCGTYHEATIKELKAFVKDWPPYFSADTFGLDEAAEQALS